MYAKQDKIDPYAELDYRADAFIELELKRIRKIKRKSREHIHFQGAPNGI